jgi:hypothetical protein
VVEEEKQRQQQQEQQQMEEEKEEEKVEEATPTILSRAAPQNPDLHKLVLRIKKLQLDLQCHLEVVHVPGTTMIAEGADGLSRGVWMTHLQSCPNYRKLMSEIFQ